MSANRSLGCTDWERMDDYRILDVLGQGTYGKVYKALHIPTDRVVAIKKTLLSCEDEGVPSTTLREVAILRALQMEYVVNLIDVIHKIGRGGRPVLYLIFEYLNADLKNFMAKKGDHGGLDPLMVKNFCYQILLGLRFCHANSIMHRDLKPQNLLVANDHLIKLADFGLGRVFSVPVGKYTHDVVTLWYRAPEILLGTKCYSTAIDMWSVGCILGEMARGKPLFTGENEIEQLLAIFRILGTPCRETWPTVEDLRDWHEFPQWKPIPLSQYVAELGSRGCDLLDRLLHMDPIHRLSADEALEHPYFDEIRGRYDEGRENVLEGLTGPRRNAPSRGILAPQDLNRPPPTQYDMK